MADLLSGIFTTPKWELSMDDIKFGTYRYCLMET